MHDESHHLGRPHFHARYGDEAAIDIEDLAVIAAALPQALRVVVALGPTLTLLPSRLRDARSHDLALGDVSARSQPWCCRTTSLSRSGEDLSGKLACPWS
jgi:hypothetical protein